MTAKNVLSIKYFFFTAVSVFLQNYLLKNTLARKQLFPENVPCCYFISLRSLSFNILEKLTLTVINFFKYFCCFYAK